ncbi:F-box domain-containing protein [Mycena sanguinolenta]|uniref:F-box domain-containing protein n=1 Tax=Mycena sanguinolenta TaxID=230812 RepID=A0A8H6YHK8_9AGAR|nr:F-box domain-containing protein [Mycena sanguinolenta]
MNSNPAVTLLPYDILHDLFILCTKDAIQSGDFYLPVVLSHVSSSWRFTALTMPVLWSSIYTSSPNSEPAHQRSAAYFERSQGTNVNVWVRVPQAPNLDASDPEFALLARNAHRIVTLGLLCADMDQMPTLLGCLQVAMPALQLLRVVVRSRATEFTLRLTPGGSTLPAIPFRLPAIDGGIQWSNWSAAGLTHLSLNGLTRKARPSMESLWHMLDSCKATLQTFEFKGWAPSWTAGNSVLTPVDLPMLRYLELFWMDDISALAGLISAPDLRCLVLTDGMVITNPYSSEDDPEDFSDCNVSRLLRYLGPCCRGLEDLTLNGVHNCSRSDVDRFFATMSACESIVLCAVDGAVMDALFQPECRFRLPSDVVLPRLRYLSVTDTIPSDLGRFLLRHKSLDVAPLQSVYLTAEQVAEAYHPTRSFLGAILDMCVDDGLRVSSSQRLLQ